jgi:hypothetical protein
MPPIIEDATERKAVQSTARTVRTTFKVCTFVDALRFVATVKARGVTPNGELRVQFARDADGRAMGEILSRGDGALAFAPFPLDDLAGDGVIVLPVREAEILKTIPDDVVTLESTTTDRLEGDTYTARFVSSSGLTFECSTLDPRIVAPCADDYANAQTTSVVSYPAGVVRAAVTLSHSFLATAEFVQPHLEVLRIFGGAEDAGEKAAGHMSCSDGARVFDLHTPAFEGRPLQLHRDHVRTMTTFLTKCAGDVTVSRGARVFFATDVAKNRVFGWAVPTAPSPRWATYALSHDRWILLVPTGPFLTALKAVGKALQRGREDWVRLSYSRQGGADGTPALRLMGATTSSKLNTPPLPVLAKAGEPSLDDDFTYVVGFTALRSLFEDLSGREVELRVRPIPAAPSRPRGAAHLRTIETVDVEGHACTITRYVGSLI